MDTFSGTLRAITRRCTKRWSEKSNAEVGTRNAERRMGNSERGARNPKSLGSRKSAAESDCNKAFLHVVLHYHQDQSNKYQCPSGDDHYPDQFLGHCGDREEDGENG